MSRFGVRRAQPAVVADVAAPVTGRGPVFPTKVLSRFLAPLRERAAPVVVDLGTALGPNVTFLGEQLGCKLFVEDLLAELGSAAEEDVDEPPERVTRLRLAHADTSVDGVLCWDVLEHLGPNAARLVAGEVKRVLRPGGVVFLCFGTDHRSGAVQTTYEIVDEGKLRYRCGDRARHKRRVLQSRRDDEAVRAADHRRLGAAHESDAGNGASQVFEGDRHGHTTKVVRRCFCSPFRGGVI